ncbi:MAG: molybdopterin-guanine dinucleotide biosynthesis protein B, partial [Syntrophomonadaceae bacterium]|nr:molybdopterin-guanine dinucleotide biosynthesis protein B [Syntrophomonadaceae bacterium]
KVHIIITEGYKREDRPKIEVARRGISTELINPPNLIALVTDFPVGQEVGVPVFEFHEIEGISQFIVDNFLRNHREVSS